MQVESDVQGSSGPNFNGKENLDKVTWHPVQSRCESLQWWELQKSYTEMKPLPVKLVPVATSFLCVAPCEDRGSILFVATL